jgi:hypothetical protein
MPDPEKRLPGYLPEYIPEPITADLRLASDSVDFAGPAGGSPAAGVDSHAAYSVAAADYSIAAEHEPQFEENCRAGGPQM